ncbi:tRNA (N6-threonylcarbamoyladenosine(37)-N6)-methyltransferase TrmO [Desulfonatronovibrio magnus]|uniref:tRNA (N6-threonylcarbamoyladenosine(37)-N6)-methyltransferase TrmO n=1 Tax=Desulfonatronovibrio magnus TaxID=698827 RepID=UPI0005EB403C|nr:tRNA (N6-threonylcarbamoyladenosine(37)-N6)-methyltransferase TrmO [Desulfonatronovibrio magnus]
MEPTDNEFALYPIGYVESEFTNKKDCPCQGNNSCPPAIIRIKPQFKQAMSGLAAGQNIVLITFLNRGNRNVLQCHPRNDKTLPITGVFATRSPNRPNPLGMHQVEILSMGDDFIQVHPLEVLDQTPVVDIKPVLGTSEKNRKESSDCSDVARFFTEDEIQGLIRISRYACTKGLLSGFNGNLSIKKQDYVLITGSNRPKPFLSAQDMCVMSLSSGTQVAGSAKASTEAEMHLEIYRNQCEAGAVAHTHPKNLLSLSRVMGNLSLSDIELYEAKHLAGKVCNVRAFQPGSLELALDVGSASLKHSCIFMINHGLTCWGQSLEQAMALSDELDALAGIQLNKLMTDEANSSKGI